MFTLLGSFVEGLMTPTHSQHSTGCANSEEVQVSCCYHRLYMNIKMRLSSSCAFASIRQQRKVHPTRLKLNISSAQSPNSNITNQTILVMSHFIIVNPETFCMHHIYV